MWKKRRRKKESPNVTKVLSNVILKLYNVIIEPSNVRKKITKCNKRIDTYNVGTVKCVNETVKYEYLKTRYSRLPVDTIPLKKEKEKKRAGLNYPSCLYEH